MSKHIYETMMLEVYDIYASIQYVSVTKFVRLPRKSRSTRLRRVLRFLGGGDTLTLEVGLIVEGGGTHRFSLWSSHPPSTVSLSRGIDVHTVDVV